MEDAIHKSLPLFGTSFTGAHPPDKSFYAQPLPRQQPWRLISNPIYNTSRDCNVFACHSVIFRAPPHSHGGPHSPRDPLHDTPLQYGLAFSVNLSCCLEQGSCHYYHSKKAHCHILHGKGDHSRITPTNTPTSAVEHSSLYTMNMNYSHWLIKS